MTLRLNRGIPDVPWARHELLALLEHAHVASDPDCVGLVVTELLTNALLHGREPVEVRASTTRHKLRIEVHDSSEAVPQQRDADPSDVTGRGLMLVAGLVERWGVDQSGNGKYVWAEFAALDEPAANERQVPARVSSGQRSRTSHGGRMTASMA